MSSKKSKKAQKIRGYENVSVASLEKVKIKDGWIYKLGGSGIQSNWKKRWLVLTKDKLFYFIKQDSEHPQGIIDFTRYKTVSFTDEKKKPNCFKIYSLSQQTLRTFYMYCNKKEDSEAWENQLSKLFASEEKKSLQDLHEHNVFGRIERTLYVRVADARNLPTRELVKSHDCYCLLQIAGQAIRTQTVWKTLSPLWGEEYTLTVNDPTSDVFKIVLFGEDSELKKADPIGKVEIPISNLTDQKTVEQWYPLVKQEYKELVYGDVRLQLYFTPTAKHSHEGILKIKVVEARNLASKDANGFSDPYIKLRIGSQQKKTEIMKKTLNPVYNANFEFKISPEDKELVISVWDWDLVGRNEWMGQFIVPLEGLEPNSMIDRWYMVTNKNDETEDKLKQQFCGDIRLKLKYSEEKILPFEKYKPISQLLLEDDLAIVRGLGEVTTERDHVAKILTHLFEGIDQSLLLLNTLTSEEVDTTPNPDVIFRGNTLATKSLDCYMKLIGTHYLYQTLGAKVREITEHKKSCEVDPSKLEKGEHIDKNIKQLKEYVIEVAQLIFKSLPDCPYEFHCVFHNLQTKVRQKYGDNHITRYTAVSGFIMLRFFCPALLGPKLFGLSSEHPTQRVARTLTLIAKCIQNIANLVEFGGKEPYMKDINPVISENFNHMKQFLDELCTIPNSKPEKRTIAVDIDKELAAITQQLGKSHAEIKEHFKDKNIPSVSNLAQILETLN